MYDCVTWTWTNHQIHAYTRSYFLINLTYSHFINYNINLRCSYAKGCSGLPLKCNIFSGKPNNNISRLPISSSLPSALFSLADGRLVPCSLVTRWWKLTMSSVLDQRLLQMFYILQNNPVLWSAKICCGPGKTLCAGGGGVQRGNDSNLYNLKISCLLRYVFGSR